MNSAIESLLTAIVLPMATSLGLLLIWVRRSDSPEHARYGAALALAAALVVGYGFTFPESRAFPQRHWQWTTIASVLACGGALGSAYGGFRAGRWLLPGIVCSAAAYLFVPRWANLYPVRSVSVVALGAYLLTLAALAESLAGRVSGRALTTAFALSAATVAALIGTYVSVTYSLLAGIAAAGFAGCCLATWLARIDEVRGLGLAFAVAIGGWAYISCIEPQQPLSGLLLTPLAPLGLWWRATRLPIEGRTTSAIFPDAVLVLLVLAAAAATVAWVGQGWQAPPQ